MLRACLAVSKHLQILYPKRVTANLDGRKIRQGYRQGLEPKTLTPGLGSLS